MSKLSNHRGKNNKKRWHNPYTYTWGLTSSGNPIRFKVIYCVTSGTTERPPYRNPDTHPRQEYDISEKDRLYQLDWIDGLDIGLDSKPMQSRRCERQRKLEKRQHAYGRRNYKTHMDWVESQLDCLELNRRLHPEQPNPPRHRVLTSKPDRWYKTKKVPTQQPWCRGKRIRQSKKKVRGAMKVKTRHMNEDYVVKTSHDHATRRHRPSFK